MTSSPDSLAAQLQALLVESTANNQKAQRICKAYDVLMEALACIVVNNGVISVQRLAAEALREAGEILGGK